MQRYAEVNSNYFNSIDFDDVHAFSQGHVMDIATKPVERCNIVGSTFGYNLDQTATIQQLLCLSNKISADSFKRTYTTLPYMFLNITHF